MILPPYDQWDQTLLKDLYSGGLTIPGRYWYDRVNEINNLISEWPYALIFITGDEEALFPIDKLSHPNMIVWQQTPHTDLPKIADRYLPLGYTPYTRPLLAPYEINDRPLRYFFSGQVTHGRRKHCVRTMKNMGGGALFESEGFTQGLPQEKYLSFAVNSRVMPCPSGAVIPESFRLYEALEAGCLPIVDGHDPLGGSEGYWQLLFGVPELPFPILDSWKDLPGTSDFFVDTWPLGQNRVFAWWQKYKRQLRTAIKDDLKKLGAPVKDERLTVLMPTSPIKDHPSTKHIDETIDSIRHHTQAEILLMIDGCRQEQSDYFDDYQQYIRAILWKSNHVWENVTPILFDEFSHQAKMTRDTLKLVETPCVMFVEHDTPLTPDCEIPFGDLTQTILDGNLDVVRLLHEADIVPDHYHLMLDKTPMMISGAPILRTAQWSQRPHIAGTEYYRRIMDEYFSDDSRCMIEDKIHGITQERYLQRGKAGWNEHRIGIYAPEGNRKRSYTTDGRGDDTKYEMIY